MSRPTVRRHAPRVARDVDEKCGSHFDASPFYEAGSIVKKACDSQPFAGEKESVETVGESKDSHGGVHEFIQRPFRQEGDENFDGRAGRCRKDHHSLQAQVGGDSYDHSYDR